MAWCATIPRMRFSACVAVVMLVSRPLQAAADSNDHLATARRLYNQGQFAAAIEAADKARTRSTSADSADLIAARAYLEQFRSSIAARAYLEQFRSSASPDDLETARERLRRIDPRRFPGRERTEYLVGVGEALYFGETFGAAASVFASVLPSLGGLSMDAREHVLDWWASALDRDARARPDIDRPAVYQRIRDRMSEEVAGNPGSRAACYWLAAAARGEGDLQSAWNAAEAGWLRAPLAVDGGAALRADLELLVVTAIIPERARLLAQPPDALQHEWEGFKERWQRQQ
jgi:hypothetical protein